MKVFLQIVFGWLIFPFCFTAWYIDCKINGLSNGLANDYIFWHKLEYKWMKDTSQNVEEALS